MTTTWNCLPMVAAANNIPGPGQGHWTYRDYASLPDDGKRYEIVDGVLFMAPSPDRWHQKASGRLFSYLLRYVEDAGVGEVYTAPFDVVLEPGVVVQPDITVVLAANLMSKNSLPTSNPFDSSAIVSSGLFSLPALSKNKCCTCRGHRYEQESKPPISPASPAMSTSSAITTRRIMSSRFLD